MHDGDGGRRCVGLKPGDLVLLPFAAEHKLWRGEAEFVPASSIVNLDSRKASGRSAMAAARTETRFVCGFIKIGGDDVRADVPRTLPEMLVDRADDEGGGLGHRPHDR